MSEQDEIVNEFLIESLENLDRLDQELVSLENDPENKNILNSIFRTAHTIKGTCGFLEFHKLETLAHKGENLLDSLRSGRLQLTQEITSALLALFDAVRRMLQCIEQTRTEGDNDYAELKALMARLNEPALTADKPAVPPASATSVPVSPLPVVGEESAPVFAAASNSTVCGPGGEQISVGGGDEDITNWDLIAEILGPEAFQKEGYDNRTAKAESEVAASSPQPEFQKETQTMQETSIVSTITAGIESAATTATTAAETVQAITQDETKGGGLADSSLRVDVSLLDQLMNLVGELVLARNQILQFTKTQNQTDSTFVSTTQRLNLITSELQEGVMKTRMQPIANVWNKFPRVVRDIARACGKEVRIDMEGKETDLDKTIIEAIKDPLTHIVRNSVDHGIEKPEVRLKAGKPAEGRLLLRAFHEGGHVIIEISDDGAGINTARVKAKAIEKGLLRPEQAARMSDAEINRLVFAAGFSTADQVSNISGRGVGMDVVRSNIEKIGGAVDLTSVFGQGTTLKIKIPLTLAIVPALIVTANRQRFAIPQVSLLELLRVEGEHIQREIEDVDGVEFYRLRGNLLPLVYLDRMLNLTSTGSSAGRQAVNIVVVKADNRQFGLVVDQVHDTEEIVVKPLGKQLKDIQVFAGTTIMGDGRVALILDVPGVAKQASIGTEHTTDHDLKDEDDASSDPVEAQNKQTLLLVRIGDGYRAAIPLALVNRLEEFKSTSIEEASGRKIVQYRGGLLPLVDLPGYFGSTHDSQPELRHVVVYRDNNRSVGLVVDQILDIVEDHVNLQHCEGKDGVLGTAIIQKKVTDLLDIPSILHQADPSFYN